MSRSCWMQRKRVNMRRQFILPTTFSIPTDRSQVRQCNRTPALDIQPLMKLLTTNVNSRIHLLVNALRKRLPANLYKPKQKSNVSRTTLLKPFSVKCGGGKSTYCGQKDVTWCYLLRGSYLVFTLSS